MRRAAATLLAVLQGAIIGAAVALLLGLLALLLLTARQMGRL